MGFSAFTSFQPAVACVCAVRTMPAPGRACAQRTLRPMAGLQLAYFRRGFPPVVVAAIAVMDRSRQQLLGRHVVEAVDLDRDVLAADFGNIAMAERAHAA